MGRLDPRTQSVMAVVPVAAAATVVLVWGAGEAGVTVPPEVASALTTLISAAAAWVSRDR